MQASLALFALALFSSAFGSMVGLGGGFILVPVLRLFFGLAPAEAAGTSLVLIVASLVWYFASDRLTPYTSQARVQAFVVPVAAEVTGRVLKVLVRNNDSVQQGQRLFEVDPEQYRPGGGRVHPGRHVRSGGCWFGQCDRGDDRARCLMRREQRRQGGGRLHGRCPHQPGQL